MAPSANCCDFDETRPPAVLPQRRLVDGSLALFPANPVNRNHFYISIFSTTMGGKWEIRTPGPAPPAGPYEGRPGEDTIAAKRCAHKLLTITQGHSFILE